MLRIVSAFVLLSLATSCQSQYVANKEPQNVAATPILGDHNEQKNPYGSFFAGEKVKDTYVENVGPVATFKFIARNLPTDKRFVFASQNLGGPIKPLATYDVDDEGLLGRQIDTGSLMLDNEMWLMFDFSRGESVRYWLVSTDSTVRLSSTIVPYPIKAEGRDGAIITLRRLTPDARLMLCEGYEFNPDEKILISSQSGKMRTDNVPVICTNGRFSIVFEPGSAERSGGVCYIDIQRFSERLMLEFDWGCEALNTKKRCGNTARIQPDALMKLPTNLD